MKAFASTLLALACSAIQIKEENVGSDWIGDDNQPTYEKQQVAFEASMAFTGADENHDGTLTKTELEDAMKK